MGTTTTNRYHLPLDPADTEAQTVGCRHTDPNICAKAELATVCALVRLDGICGAPPMRWPKQYRKLKALGDTSKDES